MRTLVHLSDLHFGRTDPAVIEPLVAAVHESRPDCVVVSGDLTQRARADEFRQARAFLERLPQPQIVVPGNHDVPLYRVWERLLDPFGNYRRYIDSRLETAFVDSEIAVIGINTARALTFKSGRINEAQIESIRRRLADLPAQVSRIVVTHHPFDLPEASSDKELVGRARQAMTAFSTCGVDLLLAGHFHVGQVGDTSSRYDLPGYAALAIQAGTTTSTRGRGEANSFNILRIRSGQVTVERQAWRSTAGRFSLERAQQFKRVEGRWSEAAP